MEAVVRGTPRTNWKLEKQIWKAKSVSTLSVWADQAEANKKAKTFEGAMVVVG